MDEGRITQKGWTFLINAWPGIDILASGNDGE